MTENIMVLTWHVDRRAERRQREKNFEQWGCQDCAAAAGKVLSLLDDAPERERRKMSFCVMVCTEINLNVYEKTKNVSVYIYILFR